MSQQQLQQNYNTQPPQYQNNYQSNGYNTQDANNYHQQFAQEQQQLQNYQSQLSQQQQQQQQQEQYVPNQNLYQTQVPQQQQNNSQLYNSNYDNQGYNTMQSQGTQGRRKYPKTMQDQKTEWQGIEKHKNEVDQQIKKNENDIKNIKLKHLLTELDKKLLAEYELKREKLYIKKVEAEEMMKQMEMYKQGLIQNKKDQVQIQNHLSNFYDNQRTTQAQKDQEYRQQKLEWEQKLIEFNRERLRSEQERNRHQKDYLQKEKNQDLQRQYERQQVEQNQKQIDKQEHNNLMNINAEKQLIKEENYRQFYKDVAENQEQQYLLHYDSVMKPILQKISELESFIAKSYNDGQRRRAEEELSKIIKRKNDFMEVNKKNMSLIEQNERQKQIFKIEKQEKVQGRLQDLANYQQYLDFKKQEKLQKQQELKQYLDSQQDEKMQQYKNQERMTKNEKGFNRLDLQAYKETQPGLYAMVPGWSPQIGQLPPRQNRDELARQIMDTMKPQDQQQLSKLNNVQPTHTAQNIFKDQNRLANAGQTALGHSVSQSMVLPNNTQFREYQRVGEPENHFQKTMVNAQDTMGKAYNQREQYKYNHNPLTNPMPRNVQNPYIQQQYLNISQNNSSVR